MQRFGIQQLMGCTLSTSLIILTACGGSGKIIVPPGTDTNTEIDTADTEPVEVPFSCDLPWSFTTPQDYEFYTAGSTVEAQVQVNGLANNTEYSMRWENRGGQILAEIAIDASGVSTYSGTEYSASKGLTTMFARLVTPDGPCDSTVERRLSICGGYILEDFTTESTDWVTRGDAYWDPNGWIEMTGTYSGRKGAVYNKVDSIASGTASIRFTLKTGNGINGGADGFAFTVIDVATATELDTWIAQAQSGGGMGYGIGGEFGAFTGDALTVEIDTWNNTYNGTNELHSDPTPNSHIALTQNADPGDHLVFFDTPNVEDFQPHDLRVDIVPGAVKVFYDGTEVINENPQLSFKGGQMFFSGSTGWATNNHIFDNLEILHDCQ